MTLPIRGLPLVALDDPADTFHVASKMTRLLSRSYSGSYAYEFVTSDALARFGVPTSIVARGEEIALAGGGQASGGVAATLRSRRSTSTFGTGRVDVADVADVLAESVGVTAEHGRGAPSPGALHPLDAIVVVAEVDGLEPGFYGYVPRRNTLARLGIDEDPRQWLMRVVAYRAMARTCAFHVFLVAAFDRVRVKYGQRGHRFALLEAGHVAQSMILVAESRGVATCTVGGFFDEEVDETLDLDGVDSSVVHSVAFGAPGDRVA